ncbi:MAG TPA: hypothetical protein VGF71_14060 [Caulobacteraceae bacterium]
MNDLAMAAAVDAARRQHHERAGMLAGDRWAVAQSRSAYRDTQVAPLLKAIGPRKVQLTCSRNVLILFSSLWRKIMTDIDEAQSETGRQPNGQFGPGNRGKPKGATSLSSRAAMGLFLNDFEANRHEFLKRLRDQFPLEYFRMLSRIIPMEPEPDMLSPDRRSFSGWTHEESAQACREAARVLQGEKDPKEALDWLELILDQYPYSRERP